MIDKTIKILFLLLIHIYNEGFTQQALRIENYQIDILKNGDVFFNSKLTNPTHLQDSNRLIVDLITYEQWIGLIDAPREFVLSGETSFLNKGLSAGINCSYREHGVFQHRFIVGQIKKKIWENGNSKINLGLNLGIWQFRNEYIALNFQSMEIYNANTEWINSPIIDIGISYLYKNQELAISTSSNTIKLKKDLVKNEFPIKERGIIINYRSDFLISKNIKIIPEIYGCLKSSDSYGVLVGKIGYKDFFSVGLLYNSQNSYGMLVNGIIKNLIKIGYFNNYQTNKTQYNYNVGSHGLNLGLIIK